MYSAREPLRDFLREIFRLQGLLVTVSVSFALGAAYAPLALASCICVHLHMTCSMVTSWLVRGVGVLPSKQPSSQAVWLENVVRRRILARSPGASQLHVCQRKHT